MGILSAFSRSKSAQPKFPAPVRFGPSAEAKKRANGRRIQSMRALPSDAKIINSLGRKLVRMYESALTTNLNADFPISFTSSNAEILTSLIGVRSRARTLEQNNGYGRGMVWDWMRNIAGHDPFRLEMLVGKYDEKGKFTSEPETNRIVMDAWEEYGRPENCTVKRDIDRAELYQQAVAAMCRDGGVLYRHRGVLNGDPVYDWNDIGYALEPLEYDRLDQNWQRPKTAKGNDNEIQFGIEYNDWGGVIAYWLLSRHPGDIFAFSDEARYRVRVPKENVIALFDIRTRAEQKIGMSRMASVIRLLHQLDQFDIAHITAALTTCCKTIWIEKQYPTSPEFVSDYTKQQIVGGTGELGEDGGDGGWGDGEGQRVVNLEPGQINELEYGQKPMVLDPHFPIESAPQFKRDILRAVSAGATVWYNTLAQDMESVNFASGRLGEGAARDMAMMSQEHVISMLVRPHFEMWLKYWLASGKGNDKGLTLARYDELCKAAVFRGRRWAYTNPLQDVQADILTVEAGLDSRSHIISESPRGGNAEEVNREIQADRESDKMHDLDFSAADVTKPTISKGLPGEDKPNPLDAQQNGKAAAPSASDISGKKGKGVNLARLAASLELIADDDPEFAASEEYGQSRAFIATMRKLRVAKKKD